jgi:hypothetical protein
MNKKYRFPWKLVIVLIVSTFISCSVFAYIKILEHKEQPKLIVSVFGVTWILACLSYITMKLVVDRKIRKRNSEVQNNLE